MNKIFLIILLSLSVILIGDNDVKKKKVYRTQAGTIIRPPVPVLDKNTSNSKSRKLNSKKTNKQYSSTKRVVESNEMTSLKTQIESLTTQLNSLATMVQVHKVDTLLIYNTLFDTLTILDTTFIYTNATTTIYDTTVLHDSLYIYQYDTTTLSNTLFDTLVVLDTAYIYTSNTNYVKDTMWVFANDTMTVYDTAWVYAYDTTFVMDSLWIFAHDTAIIYDTLKIFNYDTVTIHTYSRNFTPEISDGVLAQFPKWQTLDDAIKARNTGDEYAQEWINQALYEANGDWSKAADAYLKFQEIFSNSEMKGMFTDADNPEMIGPQFKYRSVVFDTLEILTFDTTVVQDTIRDLVHQTIMEYDTSFIIDPKLVIQNSTPPGHELFMRYYGNGNIRERGMTKDEKRNGPWIYFDEEGTIVRKVNYDMGKIVLDDDGNRKKKKTTKKKSKKKSNNKKSESLGHLKKKNNNVIGVIYSVVDITPTPKADIIPEVGILQNDSKIHLKFVVDINGKAHKISILKSTRDKKLDYATINAIKNTIFNPAILDQEPVSAWTEFHYEFKKPKKGLKKITSFLGLSK